MFGLVICVTVKLLRGLTCLAALLYSLHVSADHQTLHSVSLVCTGCNCREMLLSPGSELYRRSSMLRNLCKDLWRYAFTC